MRTLLLLTALSAIIPGQQTPPPTSTAPPAQSSMPPPASPAAKSDVSPDAATPSAPPSMSPSDAYAWAMQPFTNARNASDDLTEADKWALSIGIVRAKEQCARLARQTLEGEDLLAMGKLCVFGQEFEAARQVLIAYLGSPQMKAPEVGRLLLIRAFLGVHSVVSAESQIESLLSLYPYDASIQL